MSTPVGRGIFTWNGSERRSDRYGSFVLSGADYNQTTSCSPKLDFEALQPFLGRRVRLTCKVLETRPSGHIGDLFLGIKPSTPEVGDLIELGVGHVTTAPCGWSEPVSCVILQPEDDRQKFWMDPRILYRLHDQTVELYAEATEDPCHPAPVFEAATGMKSTGEVDPYFQVKNVDLEAIDRILPAFESLGEGLFTEKSPRLEGEDMEYILKASSAKGDS